MPAATTVTVNLLRRFHPMSEMKRDSQIALAGKLQLQSLSQGRLLFRDGENVRRSHWLVSGTVELRSGDRVLGQVVGGSPEAAAALGQGQAGRCSARAQTDVQFMSLDTELLDVMLTWDKTGVYEVAELRGHPPVSADAVNDWMALLLQNPAMQRIPAANLQSIFRRMQRRECRAGEVIVRQDDEGDQFYTIVSGRCEVTRQTPQSEGEFRLAELGPGQCFGEEALICRTRRNATVRMLCDGLLVQLGGDDFRELLNEPLLQRVDFGKGSQIVADGGQWVDVRMPLAHQASSIEGSMNIPLQALRLRLSALASDRRYVLYCDTERQSAAASFILQQRGMQAYVLRGGLRASAPQSVWVGFSPVSAPAR